VDQRCQQESPFQQSRRGVVEQSIDWALGLQGRVSEVSIELNMKGKKAGTVVLEAPAGNLSLSIGLCTFVYEEPKEAKPVVRAEGESTTVSALSVFFPSNERVLSDTDKEKAHFYAQTVPLFWPHSIV
jgi:hypothetical protein